MILTMVWAAIGLLSTLLLPLIILGMSEVAIANNLLQSAQAFYLAESGLELAVRQANRGEPITPGSGPLGAGTYQVSVHPLGSDHIRVQGTGRVGTAVRRVSNVFERNEFGVWTPTTQFREESE